MPVHLLQVETAPLKVPLKSEGLMYDGGLGELFKRAHVMHSFLSVTEEPVIPPFSEVYFVFNGLFCRLAPKRTGDSGLSNLVNAIELIDSNSPYTEKFITRL